MATMDDVQRPFVRCRSTCAVPVELGAIPVDRLAEVVEEAYRTVTSN